MTRQQLTRILSFALLFLFPLAWWAPLFKAGLLPFFGLSEISILTGLQTLWQKDLLLALIVAIFALLAPALKILLLFLLQTSRAAGHLLPLLHFLNKLAMADIFLVALYVVIAKGVGVGHIEIGWGLYLFTACVLLSMLVSGLIKTYKN